MEEQNYSHEDPHHFDIIRIRDNLVHMDKRVTVLEVKQTTSEELLKLLREEVKQIGADIKGQGKDLQNSFAHLEKEFNGHIIKEEHDRITFLRAQRKVMIGIILTVTIAVLPYVIDYLTTHTGL